MEMWSEEGKKALMRERMLREEFINLTAKIAEGKVSVYDAISYLVSTSLIQNDLFLQDAKEKKKALEEEGKNKIRNGQKLSMEELEALTGCPF